MMGRHKGRRHRHSESCSHHHDDDFDDEDDIDANDEDDEDEYEDEDEDDIWDTPLEPIRRETPKIGRNDPCPCGSKKKYKRCCLNVT